MQNEREVGRAIRDAIREGVVQSRSDVYVTSKVSPYEQGTDKAERACRDILERLGIEYLDLLLIHWPGVARKAIDSDINAIKRAETWRVMEQFMHQGDVKALGVSNYEVTHLRELLQYCTVPPIVNQIECHPKYPQIELRRFCGSVGIHVVAYSCFGAGALFDRDLYPVVYDIAAKTGKTPAQVLLCWGLQKGCLVLAKSENPERIKEFSPNAVGLQPDRNNGRYLSTEDEDALSTEIPRRGGYQKFCWDPSQVA